MSDKKLTLPATLPSSRASTEYPAISDGLRKEMLKTERAGMDARAKVEVAKYDLAQEAMVTTRAFFAVLKSRNELEATRIEWEGRLNQAEAAVRKAEVERRTAQEQNRTRMEELEQTREAQKRLLSLFDEVMNQVVNADLSEDTRASARQFLLDLSDRVVKLRK